MSLVSTNWVEKNIENLKIIDCSWHMPSVERDGHKEYLESHIENAIFFDLDKNSNQDTDLPHMLTNYKEWEEIVSKRTAYDLNKVRKKAHVLIGLVVANNNIDQIIELIKKSKDSKEAKEKLIGKKWKLTETNVNFIKLIIFFFPCFWNIFI